MEKLFQNIDVGITQNLFVGIEFPVAIKALELTDAQVGELMGALQKSMAAAQKKRLERINDGRDRNHNEPV